MSGVLTDVLNLDEVQLAKPLHEHRIYNGHTIYVEEKVEGLEASHPLEVQTTQPLTCWEQEFQTEKHRSFIKFNDPKKQIANGQSPDYEFELVIDNRVQLRELRLQMASFLGVDSMSFIMKKSSSFGQELRDLDTKLTDLGIHVHCNIYLEVGSPSFPGEFRANFYRVIAFTENDALEYLFEELIIMQINEKWTGLQLKQELQKKVSTLPNAENLRLREKTSDRLGSVIHNANKLKDFHMFDRKSIAVETLDTPDESGIDDILINFKAWNLGEDSLTLPQSICLSKFSTLHQLAERIGPIFDIPIDQFEVFKTYNPSVFHRVELVVESSWIVCKDRDVLLSASPLYADQDGLFLVVRDKSKCQNEEKVKEICLKYGKQVERTAKKNTKTDLSKLFPESSGSLKIRVVKEV